MRRTFTIYGIILLIIISSFIGCKETTISGSYINAAYKMCEKHGGVLSYKFTDSASDVVNCNDGSSIFVWNGSYLRKSL